MGAGAASVSRLAVGDVAPAKDSLKQPLLQRTLGDVAAAVSYPYRLMRLSQITKDLVREVIEQRRAEGQPSGSGSSGASKTLKAFLPSYVKSHAAARTSPEAFREFMNTTLRLVIDSVTTEAPFEFDPFHKAIRGPDVDHYAWGNNFFKSMVKFRDSRVEGMDSVEAIKKQLDAGDNVVLLANHQTEADPQVLSLLLALSGDESLAERTIFVAGHKVTSDRLTIPFSMGRNLLTIFSKKYLNDFDEEEKEAKSARNRETVTEMQRLFNEGGNIFWVAPSGGRDRRTGDGGRFKPAAFDRQSVGLFFLMGQKAEKAGHAAHFYPLAMWTHGLVPPPEGTQASVGEARSAKRSPVAIEFGPELVAAEVGGRKGMPAAAEAAVNAHYDHLDKIMR